MQRHRKVYPYEPYIVKKQATESTYKRRWISDSTDEDFKVVIINIFRE